MAKRFSTSLIFSLLASFFASAQTVLLDENFNNCALPAGWDVSILGNQAAVWYVNTCQNPQNLGESIDGTCYFMFDEDATGDQTPGYVTTVTSPYFDGSQFSTLALTMDVHYRDWNQANESLKIFLEDQNGLHPIAIFDGNHSTGDHIYDFETVKSDLALVSNSNHMRLVIQYDDDNTWDWWAGFDNVRVVGSGLATNVVTADFNDCQLPAGWETEVLTGVNDWKIGVSENPKAYPKSMNGTCFALFDDDILGKDAPFSATQLKTKWFDGTEFAHFVLEMDILHRYYSEIISVLVENELGEKKEVASAAFTVGGEQFDQFAHVALDLSPFRSQQMRVIFDYSDGQNWGWWTGIDNVKIYGYGQGHDLCDKALPLVKNAPCLADDNRTAVFVGPSPSCSSKNVGGLWYRFDPDFSGVAKLTTRADFNDVVTVFEGGCQNLSTPICHNRDEHGFTGETTYFAVNQGVSYLIRVSGQDEGFGVSRGNLCVGIEQVADFPTKPTNDLCQNAQPLAIDGACLAGQNLNAATEGPAPARNERSRADIWYKFTTGPSPQPTPKQFDVFTEADFSDVIAVFKGGCAALEEVASNELGQKLRFPTEPSTTYFIQVSGNFATVEGHVCASVKTVAENPPTNDNCLTASVITLNQNCNPTTNIGATFSGITPSCAFQPTADVWFSFVAPPSGKVKINTGAAFPHVAAIWSGPDCNTLELFACKKNPLRCDGFFEIGGMNGGETYFLQIASFAAPSGHAEGAFCLKILDGTQPDDFKPLKLLVKEKCLGQDLATLEITTTGGTQPYDYQGFTSGQTIASGDAYLVVVTDQMQCVESVTGIADSCGAVVCNLSTSLTSMPVHCAGGTDGSATATVTGGAGAISYAWSFQNLTTPTIENLPAGTYTVTINDINGCLSTASVVVSEPQPLLISLDAATNPTIGQSNGSLQITATGGTGLFHFAWQTPNGIVLNEDLANLPAGNYSLTLTDENNCSATFSYVLTEVVGTASPEGGVLLGLSPNPTTGKTFFKLQLPENESVSWEIRDVTGRLILQNETENLLEKTWSLDLSGEPSGVYALKIFIGNQLLTRRIVVTR